MDGMPSSSPMMKSHCGGRRRTMQWRGFTEGAAQASADSPLQEQFLQRDGFLAAGDALAADLMKTEALVKAPRGLVRRIGVEFASNAHETPRARARDQILVQQRAEAPAARLRADHNAVDVKELRVARGEPPIILAVIVGAFAKRQHKPLHIAVHADNAPVPGLRMQGAKPRQCQRTQEVLRLEVEAQQGGEIRFGRLSYDAAHHKRRCSLEALMSAASRLSRVSARLALTIRHTLRCR